MATAQELFSLTNSTEEHIVVGADRYITVPEPLKRIAVQFDHDVETVTFDCPRYWDDLDMSTMTVYINYKLPNGDLDAYPAKNINADGDVMHFDWTISNKVTQYKGNLTFLVCVKKTGADGAEVNHWNSELCTDMYISEGMECEEQTQLEYSDLITQLLERMTVVEQINVQADEMREMHDEVLSETTGIRQTSANTIKGYASGEFIQIDDISPVEHTVKTKVSGKNLIPFGQGNYVAGKTQTINGVTFTVNEDGSVTANGTATNGASFQLKPTGVNGYAKGTNTVTLSGCPEGGSSTTYCMRIKNDASAYGNTDEYGTGKVVGDFDLDGSSINCVVFGGATVNNITFYPQIELGDTATDYEPYIDPTTVTVTGCGKNLFDISRYVDNKKFFVEGDQVVAEGTSDVRTLFNFILPAGIYILSAVGEGGFVGGNIGGDGQSYEWITNSGYKNFILSATKTIGLTLVKRPESNRATFKNIQLEMVESYEASPTEYEPFKGGTYTPNADGSVDVKSVAPFMQIFTDTPGATLDCEYNKDIQKVAGINVNRYEFSIQQLNDIYTKYQVVNKPISVVICELNSLPALKIIYRLYTATISGGVVTKLFDMPVKYNPNGDAALYEQTIPNVSEFKCGYVKISDTWMDFNSVIDAGIYNSSLHQMIECHSSIKNNGVYGIAYSQTISFNTTNERDAMVTQINALISAATNVAWEHTPINKIIITPKYLGE